MDAFQPSQHSAYGVALSEGAFQAIGAGIQVAGQLAATGITIGAASSAQKSQQKHEKAMAKEQAKLAKLEAAAASAQASASQADAVVQGQSSSSTIYLVLGGVIVTALVAVTVVLVARGEKTEHRAEPQEAEEAEEAEEEEE